MTTNNQKRAAFILFLLLASTFVTGCATYNIYVSQAKDLPTDQPKTIGSFAWGLGQPTDAMMTDEKGVKSGMQKVTVQSGILEPFGSLFSFLGFYDSKTFSCTFQKPVAPAQAKGANP